MRPGTRETIYMAIASVALLAAALAHEPREAGAGRAVMADAVIQDEPPAASRCSDTAWPYVDVGCKAKAEEAEPAAIRIITVDRTEEPWHSVR